MENPPSWLRAFTAFAAARHCAPRACRQITALGRLLAQAGQVSNQALLEQARLPGRSMGTLARTLEEFMLAEGIAFGLDQDARLAAGRRRRRVEGTPASLRPAVAAFAEAQLDARERARRSGTRPRADHTIETNLAVVRDFARFLTSTTGKDDWALVVTADLERFVTRLPASRPRRIALLRCFFRWAKKNRLVLVDPTAGVDQTRLRGFHGQTLTKAEQRRLLQRWTRDPQVHPHECLVGVLSLLHAATVTELRALTVDAIDVNAHTLRLGRRPHWVPLDPTSWTALQRSLIHRTELATLNPHVLVTRTTRTRSSAASGAYLAHVLDPADVTVAKLRSTRLVALVANLDVKLVATALGLNHDGVIAYMRDYVDETRLANL